METTINNPTDFATRKTLNADNWRTLRRLGAQTNARFLAALGEGQPGLPDPATLHAVVMPTVHDGQRAPGLRFGDPRVMALLASIVTFAHVVGGLTNKTLRQQMRSLWNPDYTPAQATYDLRRLRLKGFIDRLEGVNAYQITAHGRRIATLFTKLAARVVVPTLTALEDPARPQTSAPRPLIAAWRTYERELDALLHAARIAA